MASITITHPEWSSLRPVSAASRVFSCTRVTATTGQFCAKALPSENLETVSGVIADAAKAGAKIIFLPEASDFITTQPGEAVSLTKPLAQSEFVQGV